ncbi:MAG: FecR domain-containing protein [Gammaproteobacteria bacterium]
MTRTRDELEGRANEIEQQAARWVTRIDVRSTPEEWTALDAWLRTNPRHRAAFLRLSVAWRRADELKKLAPLSGVVDPDLLDPARWNTEPQDDDGLEGHTIAVDPRRTDDTPRPANHTAVRGGPARSLRVVASTENPTPADNDWAAARVYRARTEEASANDDERDLFTHEVSGGVTRFRALAASRLAASITVLAIASIGGLGAWYAVEQKNTQTYSTHIGEFNRVVLEDGSTIALNTDSEVRVHYSSRYRHVGLMRGEALFQVAKNKEKPFDVEAGSTTVRAVGTAFSVRLHEAGTNERVDVVVSEGRIAINPPSSQTFAAGSVATVQNGRVDATRVDGDDITSKLAWTTGRLMFQGEKLSDVVDELNRYNLRKLQVADPDIAGLRIGGTFQATDPDGFARALGATFGIKSHLVAKSFGGDVIALDSGVP